MAPQDPPTNPHLVDENPEELMGEVTLDPWEDNTQIDWPNNVDQTDEAPVEDNTANDETVESQDGAEVID